MNPTILWVSWASPCSHIQLWSPLSSGLAHLSPGGLFIFEHPLRVVAMFQKYKPQGTSTYSFNLWITFTDVPLAKASHVGKLSNTVEGDCTWGWTLRGMMHWGPLVSQSTRLVSHSFTKYLLDSYYVPGILPGAWEQWWKWQRWFLPLSTHHWKEEKWASNGKCVENY